MHSRPKSSWKTGLCANFVAKIGVLTLVLGLLALPVAVSAAPSGPQGHRLFLPAVAGPVVSPLAISMRAAPAETAPGADVSVGSQFVNQTPAHLDVDIVLIVRAPNGQVLLRHEYAGQCLDPGEGSQTQESLHLAPTAEEGAYILSAEMHDPATSRPLYSTTTLASFAVRKPAPTVVPTATPAPVAAYALSLSNSADRANPVALDGKSVSGDIYVFLTPGTGASQVRFYLDNTSGSGTPSQTEGNPPYDFAGGSAAAASPYNTGQLANGAHTITAAVDLAGGGTTKVTSAFTVSNGSAPAPTPTAPPPPPASGSAIYWGVNMSGVPADLSKLAAWERDVTGKAVSIVHWGNFWGDSSGNYRNWSNSGPNNARSHGSIPMISWTPEGGDASRWQLGKIINGTHDAYIRQFATDAKNWGFPFFLRIMHEMNGSWGYPWQETQNGNQRGQFVQAWRHIVDIFRQVGVNNASYVWCPNIDYPNTTNPSFASLYPGDSYVDWTCLDGYNWGSNRSSGWQTFDQVYNYSYNEIVKIAPAKPMMIGEFGSVEQGGSKANWLTDALGTQIPSRYTRMRAAVYFNWQFDGVDWRIETSQAAKDAWRKGIGSSYYLPNQFGSITGRVAVP